MAGIGFALERLYRSNSFHDRTPNDSGAGENSFSSHGAWSSVASGEGLMVSV